MDPKKPFAENPEDKQLERPADELENTDTTEETDENTGVDIDEVVDRESYADRRHGRTNEGPADVSNPGTI